LLGKTDEDLAILLEHLVYALVLVRYRINILDVALPKASPEPKHSIRQKCKVFSEKRLCNVIYYSGNKIYIGVTGGGMKEIYYS